MKLLIVVVAVAIAAVNAASVEERLLHDLRELLQEEKRASCAASKCSSRGTCTTAETSPGMSFSCYGCTAPSGGFTCEKDNPCSSASCPGAGDDASYTGCQRTSTLAVGYFCTNPAWVYRRALLENLEEKAQEEPYKSMRSLITEGKSVDDAFLSTMKKRVLEA